MDSISWFIGSPDIHSAVATLEIDGTFRVTGIGDVQRFVSESLIPWKEFRKDIKRVCFDTGIRPSSISNWFYGCTELTTVDDLPDCIEDMSIAFCRCTSLRSLPPMPSALRDLDEAFLGCISLETFPEVPPNVIYTIDTFVDCRALSGTMTIKAAGLSQWSYMFQDACSLPGASLTVNYTAELGNIIDDIINTGTDKSSITKGTI